ncbi:zyxin-like [Triticum dicoccoides]|uniref:zyxin-like n=1 Tax=Triticum dicoccoides TaxID=85692 RepID=UPI00188E7DAF|nr:zyxin-like [Triticum dicoccoides]
MATGWSSAVFCQSQAARAFPPPPVRLVGPAAPPRRHDRPLLPSQPPPSCRGCAVALCLHCRGPRHPRRASRQQHCSRPRPRARVIECGRPPCKSFVRSSASPSSPSASRCIPRLDLPQDQPDPSSRARIRPFRPVPPRAPPQRPPASCRHGHDVVSVRQKRAEQFARPLARPLTDPAGSQPPQAQPTSSIDRAKSPCFGFAPEL